MSLGEDARRWTRPRSLRFIVVLTASALAVGVTIIAARAAGAAGASPGVGAPAGTAVVYRVSAAAQRGALDYWTPARMRAAQSQAVLLPQAAASAAEPSEGALTATHFSGVPTVGALFFTTDSGKVVKNHFCTASVVDSTVGDLVLTAAHCVYSSKLASNIVYVPEFNSTHMPYGTWAVGTIFVASGWKSSHNIDLDFAFLSVSPLKGHDIQSVTGGLKIGFTLWYNQPHIEVIGYNDTDNGPIQCATTSTRVRHVPDQMEFACDGFWTGTSGGPWIIGYNAKTGAGTVFGVIGGYEQGGYTPEVSYSAYFTAPARILFGQAEKASTPTPSPSPSPTPTGT